MTAIYETRGTLTGTIERENVATAQAYLTHDHDGAPMNMQQYLDPPLKELVVMLRWELNSNGHDYRVEAITTRDLTTDELKQLSSEVSGQNSDGLGESFEQQAFAEEAEDGECGDCENCYNGYTCDAGDEDYGMISFDWKTNDLAWTKIV